MMVLLMTTGQGPLATNFVIHFSLVKKFVRSKLCLSRNQVTKEPTGLFRTDGNVPDCMIYTEFFFIGSMCLEQGGDFEQLLLGS